MIDGIVMHILPLSNVICISHFANVICCFSAYLKLSVIIDLYDCLMFVHILLYIGTNIDSFLYSYFLPCSF
jgi:hypothetical protein